eukprot:Sspe_Gene.100360::Locus_75057_Transcript_1_1_Confidence_1.000_Length_881::g.100360::m.100360/K09586/ERP29; endoplasmic reticulum protein 29
MRDVGSLLLLLLCVDGAYSTVVKKGVVNLDVYTFDKVVRNHPVALVKFDREFPFGAHEDAFREVAEMVLYKDSLLMAEVSLHSLEDRRYNEALLERFGIAETPALLLFKEGDLGNPVVHNGGFNVDSITRFLRREGSVEITLPGCIAAMDALAAEFASGDDKAGVLAKAEEMVKTDFADRESAGIYTMIMAKLLAKTASGEEPAGYYVEKEITRLRRVLSTRQLVEVQKQQMQLRINILESFREG